MKSDLFRSEFLNVAKAQVCLNICVCNFWHVFDHLVYLFLNKFQCNLFFCFFYLVRIRKSTLKKAVFPRTNKLRATIRNRCLREIKSKSTKCSYPTTLCQISINQLKFWHLYNNLGCPHLDKADSLQYFSVHDFRFTFKRIST